MFEMWPSVFINMRQFKITTWRQHRTHGNVNEVLLLFFGEFFLDVTQLLDSDHEKNGFNIGFLFKPFHKFFFQLPPPGLQVVFSEHEQR